MPIIVRKVKVRNPPFSSFMTYHNGNTTGVTREEGSAYRDSSGALAFILGCEWGPCYTIFSFLCSVL